MGSKKNLADARYESKSKARVDEGNDVNDGMDEFKARDTFERNEVIIKGSARQSERGTQTNYSPRHAKIRSAPAA